MKFQARPIRSELFVPGNKEDWMRKAPRYGADALILDLEDSVPPPQKPAAREAVGTAGPGTGRRRPDRSWCASTAWKPG